MDKQKGKKRGSPSAPHERDDSWTRDDFLRDRKRDGEQGPRLSLLVELDRIEDLLLRLPVLFILS